MQEDLSGFNFEADDVIKEAEVFKARFLGNPINPQCEGAGLVEYRRESLAGPYAKFAAAIEDLTRRYRSQAKDSHSRVSLGPLHELRPDPIVRFGPLKGTGLPWLQVPFVRYAGEFYAPRHVCYSYGFRDGLGRCQKYKSKWADPEKTWGYPRPMAIEEVEYWLNFFKNIQS